jgi:ABC-type iron transport system FetAB ATPase subunit
MEDMDYHEFVERVVSLLLKDNKTTSALIGYDKESVNIMLGEYLNEQKVARQNTQPKKRH